MGGFRILVWAGLLLTACAGPPSGAPLATSAAPTDMTLAERFYHVAFYDEMRGREMRLARWEGPLWVRTINAGPWEAAIADHLALLARTTGLDARLERGPSAQLAVLFLDDPAMEERAQAIRRAGGPDFSGFTCFTLVGLAFFGQGDATVHIRKGLSDRDSRRCIVQEITQTLGLYYDTDGRSDTAFSSGLGADHLTAVDLKLLRILYDPRLKPGMSAGQAMPLVREIAGELEVRS